MVHVAVNKYDFEKINILAYAVHAFINVDNRERPLSSSTVCGVVLECGCEYYGSSVDTVFFFFFFFFFRYCAGQRFIAALSHNLEWGVESTTVTHSSADWWDLLLPLA